VVLGIEGRFIGRGSILPGLHVCGWLLNPPRIREAIAR